MAPALSERLTLPLAAALVCAGALAAILAALGFEHLGGYVPCPLCLKQRYAYYAGVPLAAAALFLARAGRANAAAALLALAGLGFAVNAGLGVYHSGIEWKWWPGPATCAGGDLAPVEGNLLDALKDARVIACDEAPWRFLGLSFAGWNAVISLGLALAAFLGVRNARNA